MDIERSELQAKLADVEKRVPALEAKYVKACKAHDKFTDYDAPEGAAELKARRDKDGAQHQLWGVLDTIKSLKAKLTRLDAPGEVERRVEVRERVLDIKRSSTKEEKRMAGPTTPALTDKEQEAIVKKVVDAVNETGSFTRAAEKLNKAHVKTLGRSPEWYTQIVRSTCVRSGLKYKLKPQPRATKDKAPAPTQKLTNGSKPKAQAAAATRAAAGGKRTTTPDPKPSAKKKKTTPAARRATAKRK
jgi:hypothetical protein